MDSFNFVILGDTSLASELGKKGTSSDITIFDRKTGDKIITYCIANTYPEKLQPLLQSIAMSEYAILNISKLDSLLGEQIIAVDTFGITNGFILYDYGVDLEKVKGIIKKTCLSSFQITDNLDQLKTLLSELSLSKEKDLKDSTPSLQQQQQRHQQLSESDVYITIDHVFDVKGVGTVILGTIKHGEIKVYDELKLNPSNKSILIKSIQMHDDPVSLAKKPSRVGLAIKGASAKDISRGDILTSDGLAKIADTEFQIKYVKNPFFKEEIVETQNYMINIGLQIRSVKIKKIQDDYLAVYLEKPVAYVKNDLCVLFRPDSKNMRIMGYGLLE